LSSIVASIKTRISRREERAKEGKEQSRNNRRSIDTIAIRRLENRTERVDLNDGGHEDLDWRIQSRERGTENQSGYRSLADLPDRIIGGPNGIVE